MAEKEIEQTPEEHGEEETVTYKAPKYESVDTIMNKDAEDESLKKYKEALLGSQIDAPKPFPDDPRTVIIKELALVVEGRDDVTVDLSGNKEEIEKKLKQEPFTIKEGSSFRMRITFYVNQKEIVSGLKYEQKTSRKGITVDTEKFMIGSHGPSPKPHIYSTPLDEAPSGLISRGKYKVKSKFVDDDKNNHLEWEWNFEIKKDWA